MMKKGDPLREVAFFILCGARAMSVDFSSAVDGFDCSLRSAM
ncbi:hypothetical protein [Candidatus Villigracilis proximus]